MGIERAARRLRRRARLPGITVDEPASDTGGNEAVVQAHVASLALLFRFTPRLSNTALGLILFRYSCGGKALTHPMGVLIVMIW